LQLPTVPERSTQMFALAIMIAAGVGEQQEAGRLAQQANSAVIKRLEHKLLPREFLAVSGPPLHD